MKNLSKKTKIIICVVAIILLIGIIGNLGDKNDKEKDTRISVSTSSVLLIKKDYKEVENILKADGFTNIKLEAKNDLITGWLTKEGEVESISIDGALAFMEHDKFDPNAEVIITYHAFPEKDETTPSPEPTESAEPTEAVTLNEGEIQLPDNLSNYKGDDYESVKEIFASLQFTNITLVPEYDIIFGFTKKGSVDKVTINEKDSLLAGTVVNVSDEVVIYYHMPYEDNPDITPEPTKAPTPVPEDPTNEPTKAPKNTASFHSSGSLQTAKAGNSGVYAYKKSGQYDVYFIIDFDEGYVYNFYEGNSNEICDRTEIISGDLNSYIEITWNYDGSKATYAISFERYKQPDTILYQDGYSDGLEYYKTDLEDALAIRNKKTIQDY